MIARFFFLGVEVDFYDYADPHLAATTLKMFLRELPEPLLCFDTNPKISQLKCKLGYFKSCPQIANWMLIITKFCTPN